MPTLILCFHRVADPQHGGRSLLAISPEDFRRTLELVGARYRFVDLREGAEFSRERKAVVTFDDGYADNLYTAVPILREMGIPATFFITTGFIDTDYLFPPDALDTYFSVGLSNQMSSEMANLKPLGYWGALELLATMDSVAYWRVIREISGTARLRVLEGDSLRRPMTSAELKSLTRGDGFTLGPHTVSHRRLSALPIPQVSQEIDGSIDWLKSHGFPSETFFAYPYGQEKDVSAQVTAQIARRSYVSLTTYPAVLNRFSFFSFRQVGLPRLSIGPKEVSVISPLLSFLEGSSYVPSLWLGALSLRRKLMLFRN